MTRRGGQCCTVLLAACAAFVVLQSACTADQMHLSQCQCRCYASPLSVHASVDCVCKGPNASPELTRQHTMSLQLNRTHRAVCVFCAWRVRLPIHMRGKLLQSAQLLPAPSHWKYSPEAGSCTPRYKLRGMYCNPIICQPESSESKLLKLCSATFPQTRCQLRPLPAAVLTPGRL